MQDTLISTVLLKINFQVSVFSSGAGPLSLEVFGFESSRLQATARTADFSSTHSPDQSPYQNGPRRSRPSPHEEPISHITAPTQPFAPERGGGNSKIWLVFRQINTLLKPLQSLQSEKKILQNVNGFYCVLMCKPYGLYQISRMSKKQSPVLHILVIQSALII